MAKKGEKRGLGRGLSALMADVNLAAEPDETAKKQAADNNKPIERIEPNPEQPRRDFDQQALDELAASIREKGIIQPLIVRPSPRREGHFEIVAGERRWRAAQLAQKHEVPVIVKDFDDTQVLEIAIIENIQRADLNAVEEAQGYRQLMDRFGHTQERLAEALGKSRSHIANLLRLLTLPDEVLVYLREGKISAGHARALVTTDDPAALARQIIARGLSVRDIEQLVKKPAEKEPKQQRPKSEKDADTRALEADLSANLGMGVAIDHAAGGNGKLVISYSSLEDLDELCRILTVTPLAGSR